MRLDEAALLSARGLDLSFGAIPALVGVEAGLTDQVLDDPKHPYTQLLVSSVLQA